MDTLTSQLPLQWRLHVAFFVPGTPATAGSKRGFFNKKLNRVLLVPANKRTKPWMAQVSAYALEAMDRAGKVPLLTGPVLLWIEFLTERPQSHFRTGTHAGELKPNAPRLSEKKPDLTKLERAVEDALTKIVWRDDSQVAMKNTVKQYARPDQVIGANVKVYLLPNI